ncbi:MAG: phage portal protein, partial [Actinobacteria bacterium]|nr:phage portal protein [Actinomycetota bacterium]
MAGPDWDPGDPDGFEYEEGEDTQVRSLALPMPSPWSGWPAEWSTPNWGAGPGFGKLVDTAWAALDLNASVLASMPVYRLQGGRLGDELAWMGNPDPDIYTSWHE